MTNIENSSRKGGMKRWNIRIDMTPMVDLGFLLITFFIFTSSLNESKAMKFYMPKDGPPMGISDNNVLTLIVDASNMLLAYEGNWADAVSLGKVKKTGYGPSALGKLIQDKKLKIQRKDHSDRLFVIIKPKQTAEYRNVVNVLDEMAIYEVPSYAITEPTEEEAAFIPPGNR